MKRPNDLLAALVICAGAGLGLGLCANPSNPPLGAIAFSSVDWPSVGQDVLTGAEGVPAAGTDTSSLCISVPSWGFGTSFTGELDSADLCACIRITTPSDAFTESREPASESRQARDVEDARRRAQWLSNLFSDSLLLDSQLRESAFSSARWVREQDLESLDRYARSRNRWDPNVDGNGIRTLEIKYLYEVYLKGGATPLLDRSEGWGAQLLGGMIEQVDGLVGFWKTVQRSVFSNNLFRPTNPFSRFKSSSSSPPPRHTILGNGPSVARGIDPVAWNWRGDISIDVAPKLGGFNVDRVVLKVGRLKLFKDFEIDFDLFYRESSE